MNRSRLLVVASSPETIEAMLPGALGYQLVCETSAASAKQRLQRDTFQGVIIAGPLKDEYGIQTAIEIASLFHLYVLLLVPRDKMDQASYMVRDVSVFVSSWPIQGSHLRQTVAMLAKFCQHTRRLEDQLVKSRQKLQDEKTINRCKLKLIENYHWTEEKAHTYLGKTAMDHSTTRVQIARVLLNKMGLQA